MRFSPTVAIPKTGLDERWLEAEVAPYSTITISTHASGEWSENELTGVRRALEELGISVGEFCWLRVDLDRSPSHQREQFKIHLAKAATLEASCVSFALKPSGAKPFNPVTEENWSESTWQRCIERVGLLVAVAAETGVRIGAHPHLLTPLNSIARYRDLLGTFDSPHLKILLDPVNLVFPQDVFESGRVIDALFDDLGEEIIAVHTKDLLLTLGSGALMQLEETVPGRGVLDQRTLLRRAGELAEDVTLHVEHFEGPDVIEGQDHLRSVAKELGLSIG